MKDAICLKCVETVRTANEQRDRSASGTICSECNTLWQKVEEGFWKRTENGKNMNFCHTVPEEIHCCG